MMSFLHKIKGPSKKLSATKSASFGRGDRPSVPPPPPPSIGVTVHSPDSNTEQSPDDSTGNTAAEAKAASEPTTPVTNPVIPARPKRRKSKDVDSKTKESKSKFYSPDDDNSLTEPRGRFSGGKKRRSSGGSTKFYIPLEAQLEGGATTANGPSVLTIANNSNLLPDSPLNDDKLVSGDDPSRTKRQLPQVPTGGISGPPPRPLPPKDGFKHPSDQSTSCQGDDIIQDTRGGQTQRQEVEPSCDTDVSNISTSGLLRVSPESNQLSPPQAEDTKSSSTESTPKAPRRRKHTHRVKTLDCPPLLGPRTVLNFTKLPYIDSDGTKTDSGASSSESLDKMLDVDHNPSHGLRKPVNQDTKTDQFCEHVTEMDKELSGHKLPKPPAVSRGLVASGIPKIAPKPQILRPKPKLVIDRSHIASFTAEDIDICQKKSCDSPNNSDQEKTPSVTGATSRVARKELPMVPSGGVERSRQRRSRSVGAPQLTRILTQMKKPTVPTKPNITTCTSNESIDKVTTSDKPGRSLPTPPKLLNPKPPKPSTPKPALPKQKLSLLLQKTSKRSSSSNEDLTENVRRLMTEDDESIKQTTETVRKSRSLDDVEMDKVNSVRLETDSNCVRSDVTKNHCHVNAVSSGEPLSERSEVSEIYENVEDNRSLDKTNKTMLKNISGDKATVIDSQDTENIYEDISDSEEKRLPIKQTLTALSSGGIFLKVQQTGEKSLKVTRKVSRRVSRKESARGFRRKQKSFRNRVYEDVDLKDDIPEGVQVENMEFSGSDYDDDDDFSDDSFTDEDDLQFEQDQARMMGISLDNMTEDASQTEPEPPKDKLHKIANEVLSTERTYMSKLNIIDQVFHLRVIMENRRHHFLPENLIPQIFINIKSIYGFHDFLLRQLEERIANWESTKKLGDVMMKWAPFLKLYTEYINKFDHAMNTFTTCMEKYPRFAAIVEDIQSQPECGMLTLKHHMLEPIQRVPRYELLLKDYLKNLPEDSIDRADTEKALELVAKAAAHANEQIKKNEHSEKLLNLSENIIGASSLNLINPTRVLVKEGSITKISARDASHVDRYLFLFNDCLLVCVPVILPKIVKHHYKVKIKLDIEGMRVMEGDDFYTPNTFLIKTKTKSIEFHTNTAEEKDEWQAALWTAISEFTKKQMSRMMGPSLTESFENEELGKRAPTWIKDQAASMCMLCAREFTTFFRRHHCRACGRVVCGLCSARKARLVYDGEKHNRVCDNCYNTLELKLDPEAVRSRGQQRRDKTLRAVNASDASLVCGYLQMSQNKKHWEKRYFAVRDNFTLYSYKAHQDVFALTSLPLPGYIVAPAKDENQLVGKHVFKLFHIGLKKEYYFQAEDKDTLEKWLKVLEKLVRAELPQITESPSRTGINNDTAKSTQDTSSPRGTPTTTPTTVPLTT